MGDFFWGPVASRNSGWQVKAELTLATAYDSAYHELGSLPEQGLQHARRALKSLAVARGPRGSLEKSSAKGNVRG